MSPLQTEAGTVGMDDACSLQAQIPRREAPSGKGRASLTSGPGLPPPLGRRIMEGPRDSGHASLDISTRGRRMGGDHLSPGAAFPAVLGLTMWGSQLTRCVWGC